MIHNYGSLILLCAEKPNHNLMYSIGSNFCIEDPMNSPFQVTIACPLENEPQPPPEFHWSILYDDTELDLDDSMMTSIHGLNVVNRSDMLILKGIIGLKLNTLSLGCVVDNQYGNDIENTSISVCGEKIQCYDYMHTYLILIW